MQTSKVRSYVGFAVKSGKVKIGVDNILNAKKAPYIVLYDEKLRDNSKKKLLNKCTDIKCFRVPMEEVFPKKNCLDIGICETNLAKAICKEVEENS